MKTTKTLCRLIAMLLLSLLLAGCAGDVTPDNADTTAAPGTTAAPAATEPPVTEPPETTSSIPADLNFGGADVNFLVWKHNSPEYFAETMNGDIVNDAIYDRNKKVEERLGVKLHHNVINGSSSYVDEFVATAQNSIMAGNKDFDLVGSYIQSAGNLSVNGMMLNMLDLKYLDFDQPWWPEKLVEMSTIDNKLYFASGDASTTLIYQMFFMVYNTDLYEKLKRPVDPQALALEGKWTMDQVITLAADVYADLNNNNKKDEGDQYGLTTISHPWLDAWYAGADLAYVENNADGKLVISDDFMSEKTIKVIEKLNGIFWASNDGYYADKSGDGYLTDGTSLFFTVHGESLAQKMRDSSYSYGILPTPKFDESQQNYVTCLGFRQTLYSIPIDAKDPDMSAAVLECLGEEGYKTVTPAIFESSFKYKYSNSENDAKCFDLIRSGVTFDLGRIYHNNFAKVRPVNLFRQEIQKNTDTFASSAGAMVEAHQKTLDDIYSKIKSFT